MHPAFTKLLIHATGRTDEGSVGSTLLGQALQEVFIDVSLLQTLN